MSGGIGTRLRPLTCHLPKPMVPIFNKPVMEYGVDLLNKHGINDIGLTLCYLPHMITDYFEEEKDGSQKMNYYIEDRPLGTGGSVKNAYEFLDSTFVVISGDAFTDIDLQKAYEFHKKKGSKATLILKKESVPLEYGVVVTDKNGRIVRFLEKPSWGEVFSDTINTGIYILEPEVLDYYKVGENFDFSKDLFPRLLEDNIPIYGYITEEYWCDVGDLDTYIQTHVDILSDKKKHYLLGENYKEGLWIGEGTIIEENALIYPPVYIGEDTIIKEGAVIKPYSVIGNSCIIGEGTSIKRSILWDNVKVSKNCEIRKSIICNNVSISERSRLFEGVAVGSYSKISEDSTIKPEIKIWPYKTVDERVTVKDNLIWRKKASKKLFGNRDISGKFNEDITPEIATGLGTAFATIMKGKGNYIISSDEYNISKSIKNSITSGILSTGSQVIDIKDSTIPICRFGVKYFNSDGGVHIRTDRYNEDMVYIEFINKEGANIDKGLENKIERCLMIEDYKRYSGKDIEDVVNIYNFSSIYLKEGINELKYIDKIKNKKPKLIIGSKSKNISKLGEKYLINIGCQVDIVESIIEPKIIDIKDLVQKNNGDLGVLISSDGERISLTDGLNIIEDEQYYLFSLLIGLKDGQIKDSIIPYNFPRIMETLSNKYEGKTIYSKSNISNIIQTTVSEKSNFQYTLNFDGIRAVGRIIDYIIGNDSTLSKIVEELPEYFYLKKEIPCNWDDKGNVIRRLTESKGEIELKEGVRFIDDNGWALIIPDEEKPVFNLYIEGSNEEYAEELWIKYDEKIRGLMK